jgi:hypothetical protein
MAQLTLRDIASNEEIIVPPEGFVFGRAGGDADIQLDDATISKRQARVSSFQGRWVLEVMVVPPGQRLPKPQPLQEGQTFYIGESEFEVVAVEGDEEPPPRSSKPAAPAAAGKAPRAAPPPQQKTIPQQAAPKRPTARPAPREEPRDEDAAPAGAAPAAGGAAGIKALFVGVPKGIAYYLVNVPKMLVNPLGTVRNTIAEQPTEPLGQTGLIGYALPSLLVSGLLGSIAGGIAILIRGGGFSVLSFIPIVPAISAVIVAVVLGFIYHPVLKWLINFLKGESDERSRSNYFLQMQTLSIVLAVPNALGAILGALPIPFINLLGPLLMTLASLVSIYVVYQWFVYFKVVQWFRYLILGLGAVSVIFAALGLVTGVIATVRGLGSGGGSAVVATGTPADVEEAVKAAQAAQQAALEAAEKGGADAEKAVREAQALAEKATRDATARARASAKGAQEAADKAAAAARPPPEEEKAAVRPAVAEKDPPPPVEEHSRAAPPPAADEVRGPAAAGAYAAFSRKREALEHQLAADPTVLAQDAELQRVYGSYLEAVYKAEKKYTRDVGKEPEKARLYEHLKNADIYRQTGPLVDKLAGRLGIR